jgi:septal ring factor EnvC (AmiA/AmiB activator)
MSLIISIKKRAVVPKLTLFLTIFSLSFILYNGLLSQSQPDISDYQQRLSKLTREIENLQSRIRRLERKKSTTLSELDRIAFQKNLTKKEISVSSIRMDQANHELAAIQKTISAMETKLEEERQSIEKILITLYKFGRFNTFQLMLQAEDLGSLLSESKKLGLLARYQEKVITDYITTLAQLQSARSALELKKEEITQLISNAQKKRRELEIQERKYHSLVREIERNRKTHLKTLEELNERAEQLQILIKKLLKKEISLPIKLVPLYERKGKLPWPIEGKLITRFGLQKHPRFNTLTINNGIEIAPKKDHLVVKSIHPGKVVYTDYFQGYGNLIIIDHGMNYYSLYGHCSDFLIKKGEFVEAGQPVALIGDISSLKGLSLYFEIRFKTKPLNPLHWLRRR